MTDRADRIIQFIERLKLWEGPFEGQHFYLAPFQRELVRKVYNGSLPTGERAVRLASWWLPSGNAKTALAAALALVHFIGPEAEPGGQIVLAAADRDNASIAFNHAWRMAQMDPELSRLVEPVESRKLLRRAPTERRGRNSTLRAISSEAYTKQGLNCSFFLADEVAVWHPSEGRELWNAVRKSMAKRKEPLTIAISTAGKIKGGFGFERWQQSLDIAEGRIPANREVVEMYHADLTDDFRDEELWRRLNPAIGAGFKSIDEMRAQLVEAERSPADMVDWQRYHLNVWPEGIAVPWVDMDEFDKSYPRTPLVDLEGRDCYVGIDLSAVADMTAVVAVFPGEDVSGEPAWDVVGHYFLPEENIHRKSDADRANYAQWASLGYMTLTPGNRISHDAVFEYIAELASKFNVIEAPGDRYMAEWIVNRMKERGINFVAYGQGFVSMAQPVREIKRAILAGQFRHGDDPVMRMCFANIQTERDKAENETFHKGRSTGRIDGAVAAAMAIGRALSKGSELPSWSFGVSYV